MTLREANLTAGSGVDRQPEIIESGGTARLHLTLATTDYDHVRDLMYGVVRPEGTVLTAFVLPVEEVFYRFIKNREWDVSEMSFGKFIGYASQGNSPFIGIPVFPSRVFRHSAFYVRTDRGIAKPKDLEGKKVGIPEWAQTAGIYARGYLSDTAGVDLRKIHWVQAGMNEAGREEKVEFKLPPGIQYEQRRDTSISAMLLSGEIDAAISARVPDAFEKGGGKIVRLFPEYRAEEARYHAATGIYPIMHVIAMRRTVFERYPWVAMNLFKAFDEAKRRSIERIRDLTASRIPVPWSAAIADEWSKDFGADPFPYGLEENRKTLAAFCRFAHEQGVTAKQMTPDDLFPKEVRSSVRV
ncbi:MAG TPA: ABC transporter substrate-binding protein [Pseudolabrys sp.]|jgi:4,5-dihydroxyphthalate decarboxylase|nr:ABC transporter substrate-binding protein [Pseudolabrys sp.]